ncbi:ribosome biogenesis protein BMS1 [Trypanosoma theileri]|uniref:Ribosome biogenesis protein BMS1 n=2 Tax=Trypanosoma TaxID=5690 RepID=A0A1X0NSK0_9TRYP|nr:ribosome biogenesis protein BMS1 [Trypanosoma theileri]ORC87090.1 ribosome biogenesis protein BMS1 [Trypanosoma theileri]
MEGDNEQKNKSHKARIVGSKAVKKDEYRKKKAGIELEPNRGNNRKAFGGPTASSRKGQKMLRSLEKRETALHMPTMDKTLRHIVSEPPLLVAVVGPPGVGKSTLIRTMVKFYSGRNVRAVRGPITVVAGRSRRVTFVECPNTLTAMCDIAKVADLVLLMVDGGFGFEMETFEFLNIAQVHGFPRMFGVISHLDQLSTGKALKKRKKFLRHRFWHEVAAGAKLLCLAPMVRGMYRATDVLKLHRLLICVEPKIQNWRNTHSCVLIDRHEDITAPQLVAEDEKCNRTIAFYGYTRGKPLKPQQLVHIPGLGDFPVAHISKQEDPCAFDGPGGKSQGHKMRHLSMKQKRIYAPYCDVSGVMYDDDAIYIQEDAEKEMIERSGEGLQLLRELQRAKPMDAGTAALDVVRRPVVFRDDDAMELEMGEVEAPPSSDSEFSDDDDDENDNNKNNRNERRLQMNNNHSRNDLSLYGLNDNKDNNNDNDDDEEEVDVDGVVTGGALVPRGRNAPDAIRENTVRYDWSDSDLIRRLKNLFVTGDWNAGSKTTGSDDDKDSNDDDDEEEVDKGYESEDEEFEEIARGTKPLTSSSMLQDQDDNESEEEEDDDDENDESNNYDHERNKQNGRQVTNALAGLNHKYNSSSPSGWGAFRPDDSEQHHHHHIHSKNGKRSHEGGNGEDDDDDYDILAEDENAREDAALSDQELDGLVSSFLAPQRRAAATTTTIRERGGPSSSSLQDDDDGAIQFYDPKQQRGGHNDEDEDEDKRGGEADETADIIEGKQLTEEQERLMQKRMAKKKAFDESYDMGGKNNTFTHYHQLTRAVEEKQERLDAALNDMGDDVEKKIKLVGYFSGLYVRFVLENVPVEFVRHFNPLVPLIAGGVNAGEDQFRVVHAKLKRHRWYPKILKAQDPLLLSMGWRRFQTQPIFATEDPNGRVRYLKYTPMHMHCVASFYAPVTPTNTGFVAIPVRDLRSANFRIPCTGYTVGNDNVTNIVKKLKLTGTPQKIVKTTAFIKGMFNTDLEATKYVGAKLKSVSGIRGIVKAVLKGKDGLIRATFEDKIFPSDIVFCRAWTTVHPPKYCSIQRNLVDPEWVGMRSMRELRWEHNVPLVTKSDSEYHEIKRRQRGDEMEDDIYNHDTKQPGGAHPNNTADRSVKVLLSRNQKMQLPFNMKEEFIPLEKSTALQQRVAGATTIAPEPRDMRRTALLNAFSDKAESMLKKKAEAKKRARQQHQRVSAAEEKEYERQLKKAKKETARLREFRSQHKTRK